MAVTTGRVCWRPRGFLSPSLHRQHKNICVPGASPKSVNCRCEKLLKFRLPISFSLLAQAILQTHLPETPWRAAARRPAARQCRSRRHRRARWLCRRRRTSPGHGSLPRSMTFLTGCRSLIRRSGTGYAPEGLPRSPSIIGATRRILLSALALPLVRRRRNRPRRQKGQPVLEGRPTETCASEAYGGQAESSY
jgi:hypothetical protein